MENGKDNGAAMNRMVHGRKLMLSFLSGSNRRKSRKTADIRYSYSKL
jgi:hypothetical protein